MMASTWASLANSSGLWVSRTAMSGYSSGLSASSSDWSGCRMEMLGCSLDSLVSSSGSLENKMVKWDCSLDSLESRRGLLASTGGSSGCSSVTMAMAEKETSAGKWGLRGCNQGSRRHVQG